MQSSELRYLLEKYIDHSISAEEFVRLWETLGESRFDTDWHEIIEQVLADKKLQGLSNPEQAATRLAKIRELISFQEKTVSVPDLTTHAIDAQGSADTQVPGRSSASVIRFAGYRIVRYAAAAILLVVAGMYFLARTTAGKDPAPVVTTGPAAADVIKPGTQKALLTLADGTVIVLDSVTNGKIAQQGLSQVVKLANGQIRYQSAGTASGQENVVYNTMSTPRGGQYQLTLPDGSNIWLNAESSITYPTAFTGNERKVVITGEVYFEVAKDKTKPFYVSAGDQLVEVLGTHFNINAYNDEGQVKTSLLEGSVKVNKAILAPGQAYMNGKIGPTDVNQDIAWKNGVFNFNNQTLMQVMRQLARWYNLEVVYPLGVPRKEYGGEMGRNLTLDQVLKGLENSGIHFQLEGRRLMVKS